MITTLRIKYMPKTLPYQNLINLLYNFVPVHFWSEQKYYLLDYVCNSLALATMGR